MQQGANSATPPAKKAARTEPVVSRSANSFTAPCLHESALELASRKPSGAEVLAVQQNEWTHRRPVFFHQCPTVLVADRHHMDPHRKGPRQGRESGLGVVTQVARGCLHHRDDNRYADHLGRGAATGRIRTMSAPQGGHPNSCLLYTSPSPRDGLLS